MAKHTDRYWLEAIRAGLAFRLEDRPLRAMTNGIHDGAQAARVFACLAATDGHATAARLARLYLTGAPPRIEMDYQDEAERLFRLANAEEFPAG